MVEAAPSCALSGGFAIGARVALLWQHNANPSYKLASIPRYDDIVRTAGWAWSARAAGRRPAGDGGRPQNRARRIREAGAAGPPATGRQRGAFSTLLRQSGLRPSTCGVLATKSERKMLASTCLYSLYAWLWYSYSRCVFYEHGQTQKMYCRLTFLYSL